eukprot:CAMPEP_0172543338 /NCGR_PEP_ID=MMETSP1067-20121228/13764_1 /TAXON_ID=265564 ORGANISM="Thalassiosira punctigera, Strain Tpunct2005C2" /NCGR_SAMPLE_ID=MMETSP1067 /ASSEMBLY_ACC=CAM_ASM_000444 /LENGTH=304 /DNA_ID=CAMNT_0013329745 /DNA_START=371 /DNA_END=1285 /DNA_ORIENTATION=-
MSVGEMSDSSKPRSNGVKSAPKAAVAKNSSSSGKDKASKKSSKKQPPKIDASSKKKQKRKSDKDGTPPPAAKKKRKTRPESGSARASSTGTGTDEDSTDEEDGSYSPRKYSQLPEVGDEIAIKCPPVPPYPEGWYTGVVSDVIIHDEERPRASGTKAGPKSDVKVKNFTVHIEWDGGGEEAILNPEWRMKGDAPDKQGRVSHRDAKLRPYFKYWVNRLNSMSESEKKLSRSRAGKNMRVDPSQKVEWIQCSNPSCGKWRPLPPYMKSCSILESCNNKWYCVLNSWDEAVASCGAPQETGYMPTK